ncbi:MAG: cytochrome-c peroxidase [Campylobacteraceae bacterium]|jgi:cytochrome c peroxidase|nr:cytochrome-c peroxidase [Campylobacteraceae bacterium]
MNGLKIFLLFCVSVGALTAAETLTQKALNQRLEPIPADIQVLLSYISDKNDPISDEKIELGKKLYFDPRLSKSGIISCNTCHNLALGGVDGVETSIGHGWTMNPNHLNAPSVYNSVFNKVQLWDGRSSHLEVQAQSPIQSDAEMAASSELVVARIVSIPEYVADFKKAYGKDTKITFEKIASAIGVFERTLVTPSPYDDFLNGDEKALNKKQKEGFEVFLEKGCTKCHYGIALGGTMQQFQVAAKYKFIELGDFRGDKYGMVKTPTLRNIAETAPYFHNGQIWSLQDAVKEMASIQLGIKISDKEAKQIMDFMHSLTGRKPVLTYPILPPSTAKTPKPDMN